MLLEDTLQYEDFLRAYLKEDINSLKLQKKEQQEEVLWLKSEVAKIFSEKEKISTDIVNLKKAKANKQKSADKQKYEIVAKKNTEIASDSDSEFSDHYDIVYFLTGSAVSNHLGVAAPSSCGRKGLTHSLNELITRMLAVCRAASGFTWVC